MRQPNSFTNSRQTDAPRWRIPSSTPTHTQGSPRKPKDDPAEPPSEQIVYQNRTNKKQAGNRERRTIPPRTIMNTDNQRATRGRTGDGRRMTEGTAVFLGRNSFRMIPGRHPTQDFQTPSAPSAIPVTDGNGFAAEENVVLSPPVSISRADTARITDVLPEIARPFQAPHRRAVPVWLVAIALVLGATITLSAQAVMRRSGQPTTVDAPGSDSATSAASTAATTVVTAATTKPRPTQAVPIVAPSTLVSPTGTPSLDTRPATTLVRRSAATHERPRRARHARSTVHTPVVSRATKHAPTPKSVDKSVDRWVDPFAAKGPTTGAATHATKSVSKISAKTAWVDPFAI